jgi:drug/metabolite transporter (DMT)-like permease
VDLPALNRLGIAAGVLSGLCYSWYTVYGERGMRRYDPRTVVFYAFLFASLFWNIVLEPFGALRVRYTGVQWFWVIYIVVFGTVLVIASVIVLRLRREYDETTSSLIRQKAEPCRAPGTGGGTIAN